MTKDSRQTRCSFSWTQNICSSSEQKHPSTYHWLIDFTKYKSIFLASVKYIDITHYHCFYCFDGNFYKFFKRDILTHISLISVDIISYTTYNKAIRCTARAYEIEILPELTIFFLCWNVRELSWVKLTWVCVYNITISLLKKSTSFQWCLTFVRAAARKHLVVQYDWSKLEHNLFTPAW